MANANAQIVVPLDKKYVRFEAEIGLESRSSTGTVIFRLQGITGKSYPKRLLPDFRVNRHNSFRLPEVT